MEILTKTELTLRFDEIISKIKQGAIFIYPTDTIYGIGCIATNTSSVQKIRTIKQRPDTPFSIWVPSTNWIKTNCLITPDNKSALQNLPGPYTIIIKLKNNKSLSSSIHPNTDTIGIRLPHHWFHKIVEKLNTPIVTTSANRHNEPFMTSLENLDKSIEKQLDFIIYEGPKEARPSKIINTLENVVKER
jgi:L-threonylcarbamoyladenylate synthase